MTEIYYPWCRRLESLRPRWRAQALFQRQYFVAVSSHSGKGQPGSPHPAPRSLRDKDRNPIDESGALMMWSAPKATSQWELDSSLQMCVCGTNIQATVGNPAAGAGSFLHSPNCVMWLRSPVSLFIYHPVSVSNMEAGVFYSVPWSEVC